MFWYIGGVLAGFAIGYLVAQIKPQKNGEENKRTPYCKGLHDCKDCKHIVKIDWAGWVTCKKVGYQMAGIPKYCASYEKIEDGEGKT